MNSRNFKASYAGITQIRYKGQYLYGIHSQPADSSSPGIYEVTGYTSVIIDLPEVPVQYGNAL